MALTTMQIENAKPKAINHRLYDTQGLYLEISKAGGKSFRMKYRFGGKEKSLTIGKFPKTKLAQARVKCSEARDCLDQNIDPADIKRDAKLELKNMDANTFQVIALQWLLHESADWCESHKEAIESRLTRWVFPYLGDKVISDITTPDIDQALQEVKHSAPTVAKRCSQMIIAIFNYAIVKGKATYNVAEPLKRLFKTPPVQHYPAPTDPKLAGDALNMIDCIGGAMQVQAACKLLPLFFCRPGEMVAARWEDIDFDKKTWSYIISKTGSEKREHIIPLANQAIVILKELHAINEAKQKSSKWVFVSLTSTREHITAHCIGAAFKAIGIPAEELVPHGCRAMARTLLDEQLEYPQHIIEHQLAHMVKDPLGNAYNRTKHLDQRQVMMQAWADYIDQLKKGK